MLHEPFRPQLFNLEEDPNEFIDLGDHPAYAAERAHLHERLFSWHRNLKVRTEVPAQELLRRGPERDEDEFGIMIGHW